MGQNRSSRMSKKRLATTDSIRGMSSRQYYSHKQLTRQLINDARKYLTEDLWKKLDRRKPVSERQGRKIIAAVNQSAVDICQDFPFEYPYLNIVLENTSFRIKKVVEVKSVAMRTIPHVDTEDGPVYFGGKKTKITIDEVEAPFGFYRHAIERLFERGPAIDKLHLLRTHLIVKLLDILSEGEVKRQTDQRPYMCAPFTEDMSGYFPLIQVTDSSGQLWWVAKTYLSEDMKPPSFEELVQMLDLG